MHPNIDIHKIIDEAMEKRDRRVAIFIMENSTSINVEPWDTSGRREWIEDCICVGELKTIVGYICPECGSKIKAKKTPYCPICGEALKGE